MACNSFLCLCSDNDFEYLSPKIKNMVNLRILAIRDNELVEVPEEIGFLTSLRELHLQGNRLTVLPPQLGQLDFLSSRKILKLDNEGASRAIANKKKQGPKKVEERKTRISFELSLEAICEDMMEELLGGVGE